MPSGGGAAVAGELDEIQLMRDRDGAREVRDEEQRAFQRRDEDRLATGVVLGDLRAELGDARLDLLGGEVRVADADCLG